MIPFQVGNAVLYGATAGRLFAAGRAGLESGAALRTQGLIGTRGSSSRNLKSLADGSSPRVLVARVATVSDLSHRGRILASMEKIRIEQHSFTGVLWVAAWLFTIGFLHLTFWKGVLAMVLWPYYLGATFSALLH